MNAIEFETIAHDGKIDIPQNYSEWFEKSVKVILLSAETKPELTRQQQKEPANVFFQKMQLDLTSYQFDREEANVR